MLANLSLSDCYTLHSNKTQQEREEIMLQSAKDNLATYFAFFGITENMKDSQSLFEKKFNGLKFTKQMVNKRSRSANYVTLSEKHWALIVEKNHLDVRLYQYAKDLFLQRLELVNITAHREDDDTVIVQDDFNFITVKEM
ncbi:unnamed protein product [Candidula unifasciata]|uniref:Heparan-sulfate 6-O-sulfotransferase n=1 Tax=Candidula unifasciata TaxID=100452 RepID=A0A8S3ZR28_9EUPU|nr:unnamed protein product [Candidula unifasciata]